MARSVLTKPFAAMADEGVDYVLVGGVAVNLHGIVRATEDADLFVRPDAENVARLRRARQLDGVDVTVATPATLWRMKRDTLRAIDAEDAMCLQAAFDLAEERSCPSTATARSTPSPPRPRSTRTTRLARAEGEG